MGGGGSAGQRASRSAQAPGGPCSPARTHLPTHCSSSGCLCSGPARDDLMGVRPALRPCPLLPLTSILAPLLTSPIQAPAPHTLIPRGHAVKPERLWTQLPSHTPFAPSPPRPDISWGRIASSWLPRGLKARTWSGTPAPPLTPKPWASLSLFLVSQEVQRQCPRREYLSGLSLLRRTLRASTCTMGKALLVSRPVCSGAGVPLCSTESLHHRACPQHWTGPTWDS